MHLARQDNLLTALTRSAHSNRVDYSETNPKRLGHYVLLNRQVRLDRSQHSDEEIFDQAPGFVKRCRNELFRDGIYAPPEYKYRWKPVNTLPISSGLPKSATASAMESLYFNRSNGVSLVWSSSSTPTLT